jgi:hypothetical protein
MVRLRFVNSHYFAARSRIDQVGIAGGDLPLRQHALVIESAGHRDGEIRRAGDRLTGVSVDFPIARARGIREAGMKGDAE